MTDEERTATARERAAAKYSNGEPESSGEPLIPVRWIWGGAGTLVLLVIVGLTWAWQKDAKAYLDAAPNQYPQQNFQQQQGQMKPPKQHQIPPPKSW